MIGRQGNWFPTRILYDAFSCSFWFVSVQILYGTTSYRGQIALYSLIKCQIRIPHFRLQVRDVCVEVVTPSTGACTLNIGTQTSDATSDNLIDGLNIGAATAHGLYDNHSDGGTNGKTRQYLDTGSYVTGYVASGDLNGAELNISVMLQLISGGSEPFP